MTAGSVTGATVGEGVTQLSVVTTRLGSLVGSVVVRSWAELEASQFDAVC